MVGEKKTKTVSCHKSISSRGKCVVEKHTEEGATSPSEAEEAMWLKNKNKKLPQVHLKLTKLCG